MKKKLTKKQLFIWSSLLLLALVTITAGRFWLSRHKPESKIRNIVLISIDTCRADYLGCYGYPHNATSNIDSFAEEAVLFNHVVTPVPLTLPAHCSMLTGTNPLYHGVHHNIDYRLNESNVTLAEILRQNGYTTAAIISSFVLDAQFGLDQGFDTYNDHFVRPMSSFYHNERRGDEATYFACQWLEKHQNEPFFLFLHYFDPHDKYRPPEPFATIFSDNLYAGEIAYTDYCIEQVITKLKNLGLYDSTLLIITSDHGEGLDEHFEKTHGYFIYHSTMWVPLIIKVPGGPKGKKIDGVVGLIDIVPTICALTAITPPSTVQGRDLSPLFNKNGKSEDIERYIYCESFEPTQYGCNPLLGVVNSHWKYIQAPRAELYDLAKDPGENDNLMDKHPKRARLLQNNLKLILQEQIRTGQPDKFVLDEESKKRLESLGYLAGGSINEDFEFDDSKNDPKDWVHLHHQIMWVNSYIKVEQFPEAEAISRQILAEQPEYVFNYFLLGKVTLARNNFAESITHLTEFLQRLDDTTKNNPENSSLPFLNRYVCEAHTYLGTAFFQQADYNRTITHYTKALSYDPNMAEVCRNLGTAYLKQNKLDEAKKYLTEALDSDPNLSEAHYNMGNVLLKQEKFEKAILHYKNALKLRPNWRQAQENLNIAMMQKEKLTDEIENHLELYQRSRP